MIGCGLNVESHAESILIKNIKITNGYSLKEM